MAPRFSYTFSDANLNVTALLEADGDVVERYAYDPCGKPTFLKADWSLQEVEDQEDGTASACGNTILFACYWLDAETGLYDIRNRVYHPHLAGSSAIRSK